MVRKLLHGLALKFIGCSALLKVRTCGTRLVRLIGEDRQRAYKLAAKFAGDLLEGIPKRDRIGRVDPQAITGEVASSLGQNAAVHSGNARHNKSFRRCFVEVDPTGLGQDFQCPRASEQKRCLLSFDAGDD